MSSALVVGASGFLGRRLLATLGSRGIGTYSSKPFSGGLAFDALTSSLTDLRGNLPADVKFVFLLHGAINPELCARDPESTRKINVDSMIALMESCFGSGLLPIFMSTDYVYSCRTGERREHEPRSPTTEYGRQKAAVEAWLESVDRPWLICRASKIVGDEVSTHSVVGQWVGDIRAGRTMRCATDQIFTPALVDDVAEAMIALADGGHTGIYHVAGPHSMSRYDLASLLVNEVNKLRPDIATRLERCKLSDFPFFEERPLDTSLSTAKLRGAISHAFVPMTEFVAHAARNSFGPSAV